MGGLRGVEQGVRSAARSELPGQPGEALRLERAERSEAGPLGTTKEVLGTTRNY